VKRGKGFAASPSQRAKVRGRSCAYCAAEHVSIDPAHLYPRSLGGCDDPLCVLALCRRCHNFYDSGRLDLLPTVKASFLPEYAHAVEHAGTEALADRRISNARGL
jgi:hypothetical protein